MTFQRLRRTPALDGVRAIAIISVVLLHAVSAYFPGGAIGVDLFFALSAFLITSLILAEQEAGDGQIDFKSFYWKRFFRLGPALGLWLAFLAAPTAIITGGGGEVIVSTLVSIFYIGDFAVAYDLLPLGGVYTHIWSLAIEEQFYLVWPFTLVFIVCRWPARRRIVLSVSVVAAAIVQIATAHLAVATYFLPWGHIIALGAGCLAADWCSYGLPRPVQALARRSWVAIIVLIATAFMAIANAELLRGSASILSSAIVSLALAILLVHAATNPNGPVIWFLTLQPITWIGRRSYGLYLYHRTMAQLVPALAPDLRLMVCGQLVIALSLLVAELSYRYIELPLVRAGAAWLSAKSLATVSKEARRGPP